MKATLLALLKRLREPSTWAAIAAVAGIVGVNPLVTDTLGEFIDIAPELIQLVSLIVGAAGGGVAMVLPERGSVVPGAPPEPGMSTDTTNAPDKNPGS